jgi:hypothetical protein
MNARPLILLFLLIPGLLAPAFSQCDGCSEVPGFIKEYCFTSGDNAPGKCAIFSSSKDAFYLFTANGKKRKLIPGNPNSGSVYLYSLAANKKLKLSATDILFIRDAILAWEDEMVNILSRNASAELFTGTDLGTMAFESRPSGLGVRLIQEGKGKTPQKGKKLRVHYRGYLGDGKVFDASYDRNEAFEFLLGAGQVIKGWDEGLSLYPVGSRFVLKIPPTLGYGERDVGGGLIPPNSTLFFDVLILNAE